MPIDPSVRLSYEKIDRIRAKAVSICGFARVVFARVVNDKAVVIIKDADGSMVATLRVNAPSEVRQARSLDA